MGKGKPLNGRHPNFKGGRLITKEGYVIVFVGVAHHLADVRGYAYEHRIEAEKKIGRKLKPSEQVHHKDENPQNNAHDNLVVARSIKYHRYLHRKKNSKSRKPGQRNPVVKCACSCGASFKKFDSSNRLRKFIRGHNV
jgi:hypothetical protein